LNIAAYCGDTGLITVGTEKRREKVVLLREKQSDYIHGVESIWSIPD
jgi:hypothetical protein